MEVVTFKAAVNYNVGHNPNGIAVGDFNEDGYPDITVPNGSAGTTIYVLINRGDGTFLPTTTFGVGSYPSRLLNADFNHDTHLDIVTSKACSRLYFLYR